MSTTRSRPVAKAIALGGVETGSTKASEHVSVTGSMKYSGCSAIERASARDGVDADAVQARIDAQLSNAERTAEAAVVIDNSADEPQLLAQLENHWKNLQERCS